MQNRFTIPFKHWSLRVGRADPETRAVPAFWGEVVSAVDDLHQSIANLILTPKGSVPTEPEKGCDIAPYIDRHPSEAIPNLTVAIWDAITIWEERVVLQDVKVIQVAFGHFATKVFWRPIASVLDDLKVTEVHFGSGEVLEQRVA